MTTAALACAACGQTFERERTHCTECGRARGDSEVVRALHPTTLSEERWRRRLRRAAFACAAGCSISLGLYLAQRSTNAIGVRPWEAEAHLVVETGVLVAGCLVALLAPSRVVQAALVIAVVAAALLGLAPNLVAMLRPFVPAPLWSIAAPVLGSAAGLVPALVLVSALGWCALRLRHRPSRLMAIAAWCALAPWLLGGALVFLQKLVQALGVPAGTAEFVDAVEALRVRMIHLPELRAFMRHAWEPWVIVGFFMIAREIAGTRWIDRVVRDGEGCSSASAIQHGSHERIGRP